MDSTVDYFTTLIAQTKNLYGTNFEPLKEDVEYKKNFIELKLKN